MFFSKEITTTRAVQSYIYDYKPIAEIGSNCSGSDQENELVGVLRQAPDPVLWDAVSTSPPLSQLPTIPDLVKVYQNANYQGTFLDMVKQHLTKDIIDEIFNATKRQHQCPLWRSQRVGALTASTLHKVVRCKENNPNNYIVREIMGKPTFSGSKATAYGHKNEAIARKLYEKEMKIKH